MYSMIALSILQNSSQMVFQNVRMTIKVNQRTVPSHLCATNHRSPLSSSHSLLKLVRTTSKPRVLLFRRRWERATIKAQQSFKILVVTIEVLGSFWLKMAFANDFLYNKQKILWKN